MQKPHSCRHSSVPFDGESTAIAGRLWKEWESKGKVIGPQDTPIAAIAPQSEWMLVTNPTDTFSRVEGRDGWMPSEASQPPR